MPQRVEPDRDLGRTSTEDTALRKYTRNESSHGITTSAVQMYPLEMTRSARERTMGNWVKRRTAVMESLTNIAIPWSGTNASIVASWT